MIADRVNFLHEGGEAALKIEGAHHELDTVGGNADKGRVKAVRRHQVGKDSQGQGQQDPLSPIRMKIKKKKVLEWTRQGGRAMRKEKGTPNLGGSSF